MSTPTLEAAAPRFRGSWADWAGMTASIGCAIHCAAMPLVIAYLPTLGLGWLADEGFHQSMAVICMALAIAAFVPGWRSHRSVVPLAWGATGLILLNAAAFGLEGSCCPKCDVTSTHSATMIVGNEAACTADASSECEDAVKPVEARLHALAGIPAPLLTPLGGFLLVIGHISNHQRRCHFQGGKCCVDLSAVDAKGDEKLAGI